MNTYYIGKKVDSYIYNEIKGVTLLKFSLEAAELEHMLCLWEDCIYILLLEKGEILCQINQEKLQLEEGEGLFINKENIWRFLEGTKCEGVLLKIQNDFWENEDKLKELLNKVTEDEACLYYKLEKEELRISRDVLNKVNFSSMEEYSYLLVWSVISQLLYYIFSIYKNNQKKLKKSVYREKAKLCKMILFLHQNYNKKITLPQMAENSSISSGEYCRFFKKRMNQTPIEYLQAYRIFKTLPEVLRKSDSITEIVLKHGFTGSSYYSEIFKKEMGCSPGEYRKWYCLKDEGECPLKCSNSVINEKQSETIEILNAKQENSYFEEKAAVVSEKKKKTLPAHLL